MSPRNGSVINGRWRERLARFAEVVALIETARDRAYQAVNKELVKLYWTLGEDISQKITSAEWGEDRRAVTIEVAFQNVALAIGMAVVFLPTLAGVAITSILWGVVHLRLGFALAAVWMRVPIAEARRLMHTISSILKEDACNPIYATTNM